MNFLVSWSPSFLLVFFGPPFDRFAFSCLFFFLKIALGQMGIFVWDIQNESATPSDCQVIQGIPWIAVAFHSVCFLLMLLAQTPPKFAWVSPISPVLQARVEWAACVLTASESNNWQNVVISISGSYPAFQRFLIFLSHRQTIFVSFWTIIVEEVRKGKRDKDVISC